MFILINIINSIANINLCNNIKLIGMEQSEGKGDVIKGQTFFKISTDRMFPLEYFRKFILRDQSFQDQITSIIKTKRELCVLIKDQTNLKSNSNEYYSKTIEDLDKLLNLPPTTQDNVHDYITQNTIYNIISHGPLMTYCNNLSYKSGMHDEQKQRSIIYNDFQQIILDICDILDDQIYDCKKEYNTKMNSYLDKLKDTLNKESYTIIEIIDYFQICLKYIKSLILDFQSKYNIWEKKQCDIKNTDQYQEEKQSSSEDCINTIQYQKEKYKFIRNNMNIISDYMESIFKDYNNDTNIDNIFVDIIRIKQMSELVIYQKKVYIEYIGRKNNMHKLENEFKIDNSYWLYENIY